MARNSRKKRLKKQDFQKVKLKVGKKLQPAQNATDTSFKSMSIFVPTQLNESSQPTNQRNQTLKDLLAQVGHYSVTSRQDALAGLKDLFQCHKNLLHENLGSVMKKVAEKMTDSEPSVRQSLLLFLCFVFPMIPQERMAPFSSLILAHLSCAMTHIYDDIQHDSLSFLELCLRYFPSLLVTSSSQLIQNFIGMITHEGTLQSKRFKGLQLQTSKGLSVNPKGKLSSLRSRLKVLQQLLAFLRAVETSSNYSSREVGFSVKDCTDESLARPAFKFSKFQPTRVQVLQHSVNEPKVAQASFDTLSPSSTSPRAGSESNILTDETHTNELLKTIVPLLLECWVECNPVQVSTELPNSVMSSSAFDVMLVIAEIFNVLFNAARQNQKNFNFVAESSAVKSFQEVYVKDLNLYLMSFFPFSTNHAESFNKRKRKCGKAAQKSEEKKNDISALVLNLNICEIMLQFLCSNMTLHRSFQTSFEALNDFVIDSLEMKAKGGTKSQIIKTEHLESLLVFAYKIIVQHCSFAQLAQDPDRIQELLEVAFILYMGSHSMSVTKRVLMSFFASLAFHENFTVSRHEKVQSVVKRWLQGLPSLLLRLKDTPALTEFVLGILKKAVVQGVLKPDANFSSNLSIFFSNDQGPFVTLTQSAQRLAAELLFHLQSIDSKLIQVIVSCCQSDDVDISVIQYILQVLYYRSPCYQGCLSYPVSLSLPLFLSALFSIAIGFSQVKLRQFEETAKQRKNFKFTEFKGCNFIILDETIQAEPNKVQSSSSKKDHTHKLWEYHQTKLQAVCQCFKQSRQSSILLQCMSSAFETFLKDFKVLPLTTAHGFLSIVKCLVELASDSDSPEESHRLPVQALSNLAHLSLVCLKYSTTLEPCTVDFCSGAADIKTKLFNAVVQLLLVSQTVTKSLLSLLLSILSDNSTEALRQDCAIILTRMFCCEARKIFRQSPDISPLVSRILVADDSSSPLKQCFADLKYQFSLFEIEVGSN
ncbi:testis-expressed protein 10-like [Montipora foliosa]|uniref:testis-expressed protein 10-like n=1 Tax=Montipora foliosa TaxID=591990 RepID=UPI0035F211B8